MTLHQLGRNEDTAVLRCLSSLGPQDTLLLHADGVLALLSNEQLASFAEHNPGRTVAVLDDCQRNRIKSPITLVHYARWVEMAIEHERVVSW